MRADRHEEVGVSAAVTLPREDGKVGLAVISNTEIATFRRCVREWLYRYIMLRRPRRASEALRFGSFFHIGLNAWWTTNTIDASQRFATAIDAMRDRAEKNADDADAFELVKAEELMLGYTARWGDDVYETLGVEVGFTMPLVNPETLAASRTFLIGGKIDAIARHGNRVRGVEHKTTSDDIGAGSDYWRFVSSMDPQISTYGPGARAAGFEVEDFLYDVVRKVAMRPYLATPLEARKYTKEKSKQCPFCKKAGNVPGPHRVGDDDKGEPVFCVDGKIITEPGGRLYENQHEHDETPEEFRLRVRADIAAKPEKYFARGPIVRLEHDEAEHAGDVWQTAAFMREAKNAKRFPRSPGSCRRFHRMCDFFDVCSGIARIDDDNRFRTAATPHEELAEV